MASKLPDATKGLGAGGMDVEDGSGGGGGGKKVAGRWPGFVHFFFVLTVVTCALVYAPRFLSPTVPVDFLGPRQPSSGRLPVRVDGGRGNEGDALVLDNQVNSPCASMGAHGICCDRSDFNTDVCFMAGEVRTDAASLSFLLFPPQAPNGTANDANATVAEKEERVRPYTRKWEKHLMANIQEVRLRAARPDEADAHRCDVRHDAPALVMTAGGYTGNLFHAFNDGFLPAWLTVQHLRRRVVLAVLAYNPWWAGTFRELVSGLSDHHVIDLLHDKRTHCFPGAIVGTRFHGILAVEPARTKDNRTLVDFHDFLAGGYKDDSTPPEATQQQQQPRRPRLGLYSRRAALLQIAPLGVPHVARGCYEKATAMMEMQYEQYDAAANESSLVRKYPADDVVLRDPEAATRERGWDLTARVYLGGQNVSLDLGRFGDTLRRLHSRALRLPVAGP
ncbi:unnamed protein product [Triticum turgidum subsp. durum]|uniref:Uncharacterized protein n=1 Tax=Triticum turgidum subsp. durum TaxID=4567 RepID=A0A9R1QXH8_TRITD|nr:unnamed protein product [Triticum turgidum subsp. durum]